MKGWDMDYIFILPVATEMKWKKLDRLLHNPTRVRKMESYVWKHFFKFWKRKNYAYSFLVVGIVFIDKILNLRSVKPFLKSVL